MFKSKIQKYKKPQHYGCFWSVKYSFKDPVSGRRRQSTFPFVTRKEARENQKFHKENGWYVAIKLEQGN